MFSFKKKTKLPVITTWKEPLAGYTEGIHGINGWALASGRGILR